jgi:hypothetical protein
VLLQIPGVAGYSLELQMMEVWFSDIDEKIVRKFLRKAIKANRLSPEAETDDLQNVVSNLAIVIMI